MIDLVKDIAARFPKTIAHLTMSDRIEALERENAELATKLMHSEARAILAERDIKKARREALEEAAKVCESQSPKLVPGELPHGVATGLAGAIRSLAEQEERR